jgi:hypothetical protein
MFYQSCAQIDNNQQVYEAQIQVPRCNSILNADTDIPNCHVVSNAYKGHHDSLPPAANTTVFIHSVLIN